MTPQRFEALAQAYGADLRLWPAAEQAAAKAWRVRSPHAEAVLAEARRLDDVLATDPTGALSADAQRTITTRLLGSRRSGASLLRWLSGLGAMGALGAGMAVGAAAMALAFVSPSQGPEVEGLGHLYEQSSFGDPPATAAQLTVPTAAPSARV